MRPLYFLPFVIFAGFFALWWFASGDRDTPLPTALAGKPIPQFSLPDLFEDANYTNENLATGNSSVTLVNFFASWCVPCRAEHPLLIDLAQHPEIDVVGIAYKNQPVDAKRFLQQLGNPYVTTVYDRNGRVSIDWGVSGVPETFIIVDGQIIDRVGEPLINPTGLSKLKDVMTQLGIDVKI